MLLSPQDYAPEIKKYLGHNPPIKLERKTNRHPSCDGTPWGWYEIWPLRIEVGYWSASKDDMAEVDITA